MVSRATRGERSRATRDIPAVVTAFGPKGHVTALASCGVNRAHGLQRVQTAVRGSSSSVPTSLGVASCKSDSLCVLVEPRLMQFGCSVGSIAS